MSPLEFLAWFAVGFCLGRFIFGPFIVTFIVTWLDRHHPDWWR